MFQAKSRSILAAICFCISSVLLLVYSKDTAQAVAPTAPIQQSEGTFYGGYKTVEGMQAFLDAQAGAHPTLAEKVDFGDSWCKLHAPCSFVAPDFNGYDLYALRISNKNIPGPKPVFWFDAGIHANEIVGPELAMRFIGWLLDNYETDADAHWLVDYHDIWVAPIVNPDGHHVVEAAGGDQIYLQRKNLDNTNGCTTYPPNGNNMLGTDLNRNFPYRWDCCAGASNDPCFVLYRGPSAGSEPETQAIMSILKSLIPDQRGGSLTDAAPLTATGVAQSMHSFLSTNLYPWGFDTEPAPNRTDFDTIASHMSAPEAGGNGYAYCQAGSNGCVGTSDGDTLDWVYGELGAAAVTTELEGNDFTMPYAQVDAVWNHNKGMLTYLARIARTPFLTARGPDANNPTVEPQTVDAGSWPRISASINYAWSGNFYRRNVGAAAYYVDNPPWANGVAHPMSPTDGALDSQTELMQASVDTTGLAPGRHVIYVQGRGNRVYEGHEDWGPVSAVFLNIVASGGTPAPSIIPSPTPGTPLPNPTATQSAPTPAPTSTITITRTPIAPPAALPGTNSRTFTETGKTVTGLFLDYWNDHGGLAQRGYPISEVIGEVSDLDGKPYTVQYFERAVFEYHPEQVDAQYKVLLSQLGTFRYKEKYPNGAPSQLPDTSANSILFPETGKHLGGIFLKYWQTHGELAQQGYPISDEFTEISDLDGKPYTVQYFERAVFELHPENANTPYQVLLSQLGTFRYKQTYP